MPNMYPSMRPCIQVQTTDQPSHYILQARCGRAVSNTSVLGELSESLAALPDPLLSQLFHSTPLETADHLAMATDREESLARLHDMVYARLNRNERFIDIADDIRVHRHTLSTWMCEDPYWQGVRANVSDLALVFIILVVVPLDRSGAFWGQGSVWSALAKRGLRVGRRQVARVLRVMQPQMVFLRDARRTRRRAYSVIHPMVIWHMDSWDKLYMFGFRVHAAIDGGSRFVVWAKLCNNQHKETLFAAYMEAVDKWGRPLRIRSDGAMSHVLIQADIQAYRGHAVPRPYLKGSSTHNQRIELWWRHMRRGWGNYHKTLFENLVAEGWLDAFHPWHLSSLHAAFWAEMESDLHAFVDMWNNHIVRRQTQAGRMIAQCKVSTRFREWERLRGLVEPPPRNATEPDGDGGWLLLDNIGNAAGGAPRVFPVLSRDDHLLDVAVHPDPGLPEAIAHMRDSVYQAYAGFLEGKARYRLHLSITSVCCLAQQAGLPLAEWLEATDLSSIHPASKSAALLIARHFRVGSQ